MGETRSARGRVVDGSGMVIEMNADEIRKATFAEARAQSYEILERVADVEVEHRSYHDDDPLMSWRRGMPKREPEPPPPRTLTDAEIARMISAAMAEVADAVFKSPRMEALKEAIGMALAEERKKMRGEIVEQVGQLRAEITIEKAAERHDGVVELPRFLSKRTSDAARS